MALCLVWAQALADPYLGYFTGEYDGQNYRVTIDPVNATTYDGLLFVGDAPMQLDARRYGEYLTGRLASETGQFGFRARITGSILVMETEDGRRIVFNRSTPE